MNDKIVKAQQAFNNKKYKHALSIVEKINKSRSKQSFVSLEIQAASLASLDMGVRAKEAFLNALSVAPDEEKRANTYHNLSSVCLKLKQYSEAKKYISTAIKLMPPDKNIMWRLSLANMHYQLREYDQCEDLCLKLLVYKPCTLLCMHMLMDIAIAQTNTEKVNYYLRQFEGRINELAGQEILGVYAKVEAYTTLDFSRSIDKAIARGADPLLVKVMQASMLLRKGEEDKSFEILKEIDVDKIKDVRASKRVHEILGKTYDKRKEYGKAFQNFTQMNKIAQRQYQEAGGRSRELSEVSKLTSLKLSEQHYTAPLNMVFLVGFPRSGTTLLENILDSQQNVIALPERPMLDDIKLKMTSEGYSYPKDLDVITDSYLAELRSLYFQTVLRNCSYESLEQFDVLMDKNPINQIRLPLIKKLFPEAKIILALRHPLDCILSCYMQNFGINKYLADFSDWKASFERYKDTFELYEGFREYLDWDEYQIKYEDLVNDFENQIESVLKFIGIDADKDSYMNFNMRAQSGVITTPSGSQVRQGIYKTATQRWLNYKDYIAPHIDIVRPYIEKYGYTADI